MAKPNPEELFNLGMLSYDKQDFSKARKYFEKACELKDGGGCFNLGELYLEKDSKKAVALFEKSCDLNISRGCGALGVLYYNGQGVEKNLTKAAQYISKACKLGDQKACEVLKEK
ncbi:tetratricopeptide repeat protein [Helicobacter pylori]